MIKPIESMKLITKEDVENIENKIWSVFFNYYFSLLKSEVNSNESLLNCIYGIKGYPGRKSYFKDKESDFEPVQYFALQGIIKESEFIS